MVTETLIEDDRWCGVDLPDLAERVAGATLQHLGLDPDLWEISLMGCDDARIAQLNAAFRGKPSPTNVLSWPATDLAPARPGGRPALPAPGPDPQLGDIAIAYETCAREALEADKPFAAHVTHLIVHAVLHLLGYDHIRDEDATVMQTIEIDLLGKLGLTDPYWADE